MPSGYTAGVQDGTITDFRAFALGCARAFGALIVMRDDPADAPIPDEFKPDGFYASRLADAEKRLAELKAMKPSDVVRAAAKARTEEMDYHRSAATRTATTRQRYEAMIRQVEAWQPPTADHVGMKEFMAAQLRESLDWDCHDYQPPPEKSAGQWHADAVAAAAHAVASAATSLAEETKRCADRTAWVRALRESLAEPTPALVPA
jgi:hypothetical protein